MCFKKTLADVENSEFDDEIWDDASDEEWESESDDGMWEEVSEHETEHEATNEDSSRIRPQTESRRDNSYFSLALIVLGFMMFTVDLLIFCALSSLAILLNRPFSGHLILIGYGLSRKLTHNQLLAKLLQHRSERLEALPQLPSEKKSVDYSSVITREFSEFKSQIERVLVDGELRDYLGTLSQMTICHVFCGVYLILLSPPSFQIAFLLMISYDLYRKFMPNKSLLNLQNRYLTLRDCQRPLGEERIVNDSRDVKKEADFKIISGMKAIIAIVSFFNELSDFHRMWIIIQVTIFYEFSVQPILLDCPFLEATILILIGYGSSRKFIHNMLLPELRLYRNLSLREWKLLPGKEKSVDDSRESWRPFGFVLHNVLEIEIFIICAKLIFPIDPVIFRLGCAFHALFFFYLNGKYVLGCSLRRVFRMVS